MTGTSSSNACTNQENCGNIGQYAREHTVAEQTTALDLNFKLAVLTDKSQPSRWSGEGTEAYRQLSAGLHLTTMGR